MEDAGATSDDPLSDVEDESLMCAPRDRSDRSREDRAESSRRSNTRPSKGDDRRIVPKESVSKDKDKKLDAAAQLKAMFAESDDEKSPTKADRRAPRDTNTPARASATGKFLPSPEDSQKEQVSLSLSRSEKSNTANNDGGERQGHLRALESERAKNKVLEIQLVEYERRLQEMEQMLRQSAGRRSVSGQRYCDCLCDCL